MKYLLIGMILLIITVLLWGCATPAERIVEVKVPVAVPCNPPAVEVPIWPLDTISPKAELWTRVTAALSELDLRIAYELQLRAALDSCRFTAVEPPSTPIPVAVDQ